MNQQERDFHLIEFIVKYGFIIGTFILSMVAKVHSMIRFKKRMTRIECVTETLLCGLGSALAIYVLTQMSFPKWVFCLLGGFSSLIITPITSIITKEATPILELLVISLKEWIKKWFANKNKN